MRNCRGGGLAGGELRQRAHGFANPSADGSILPSARYDARASARAWMAMQAFLAEALGGDGDRGLGRR